MAHVVKRWTEWSEAMNGARRVQQQRSLTAKTAEDDDRGESVLEWAEVTH